MGERGWSFIRRAGTVILLSAIVIWFTQTYGWEAKPVEAPEGAEVVAAQEAPLVFGEVENTDHSILGRVGSVVAPVFEPLGFGDWKPTVATVLGLVAKEEVVNVFGIVYQTDTDDLDTATLLEEGSGDDIEAGLSPIAAGFNETSNGHGALAAFAFMIFNLLCAPCFAAIGAIKREMNNAQVDLVRHRLPVRIRLRGGADSLPAGAAVCRGGLRPGHGGGAAGAGGAGLPAGAQEPLRRESSHPTDQGGRVIAPPGKEHGYGNLDHRRHTCDGGGRHCMENDERQARGQGGLRLRRRLQPLQGLPLSPSNPYLPEESSNNPSLRG